MYTPLSPAVEEVMKKCSMDFFHYENIDYLNGHRYCVRFENGYGISIIKHDDSYGRQNDLWEIAVLHGDDLCYDTPIANDVVGWLTEEEVLAYFFRIKDLTEASSYIGKHEARYLEEHRYDDGDEDYDDADYDWEDIQ